MNGLRVKDIAEDPETFKRAAEYVNENVVIVPCLLQ